MDISETIEPRSDQQNADDYLAGPKTVTVEHVKVIATEQPVEIHLVEFPGRPFKPSKSMRRVLIAAWGAHVAEYAGRRMTLYCDPSVKFGGQAVGGIRISHLSHINKPLTVALTVTRGKRAPFTVQPLPDAPDEGAVVDAIADLNGAESIPALKAAWDLAGARGVQKHPNVIAAKEQRKADLTPTA